MRLCVYAQLPVSNGGLNGEAFYLHTSNFFNSTQLENVANECIRSKKNLPSTFTVENVMKGTSLLKLEDVFELIAFTKYLKSFLERHTVLQKAFTRFLVLFYLSYS